MLDEVLRHAEETRAEALREADEKAAELRKSAKSKGLSKQQINEMVDELLRNAHEAWPPLTITRAAYLLRPVAPFISDTLSQLLARLGVQVSLQHPADYTVWRKGCIHNPARLDCGCSLHIMPTALPLMVEAPPVPQAKQERRSLFAKKVHTV